LSRFVIELDDDVLAKILQRDLAAQPGAELPDLVGPLFEVVIVGYAALERDRFVLGAAR
jgi:hypothetical protein